jgi:hypothetical protein
MASVAFKWFGLATTAMLNAEHDWLTSTYRFALTNSSYTPLQDTHDYFDDVTNEFATAGGYTAEGATADNKTIGYTGGTNVTKLDCDDPTWATATLSDVKNIILYCDTGTPSTSGLLGYGIVDSAVSPSAGNLVFTLDAAGVLTTTAD